MNVVSIHKTVLRRKELLMFKYFNRRKVRKYLLADKPEIYTKSLILNCMIMIRLNNEKKERCQTDKQKEKRHRDKKISRKKGE